MLRIISIFLSLSVFHFCSAQSYTYETFEYEEETREYAIYIPESYDESNPVPLVFNFHGGGGDIDSQIAIADMSNLANTDNFIVVYPQALPDPNDDGSTNWLHKDPTEVDDVFFIDALIEELSTEYQINPERIYACGYSLGGEFTYELACRLNHKIAAIGVVARTMQAWTLEECAPEHPTGVLTILGTDDFISNYEGISWGGVQYYLSADEVHEYWRDYNNCILDPILSEVPNSSSSDGSTVERYSWADENDCVYVEHLKVLGGGHDWPGSFGNMDIDASEEIWQFVSRYDLNGLMSCATSSTDTSPSPQLTVSPNPFTHILHIKTDEQQAYQVLSPLGKVVKTGVLQTGSNALDLSLLPPGIYLFTTGQQTFKTVKTE